MPTLKKGTVLPAAAQERKIAASIAANPDTMELDSDFFARAKPARRGKQKRPTKVPTTIRFSDEVLAVYKHMGKGWQTQMDDDLKELIAKKYGKQKASARHEPRKKAVAKKAPAKRKTKAATRSKVAA